MMNREAIKRLVSKSETAAAEFKRARGGVPVGLLVREDAYKGGMWIVKKTEGRK